MVKTIKWTEVKVNHTTNVQTEQSEQINSKTSESENSEVETQAKDNLEMPTKKADNDQNEVNEQATEQTSELENIVRFYAGIGDVLHFPQFDNLKTTIIAQPMDFIRYCRYTTIKNVAV
jgi:hypothetical protein